MFYTQNWIFLLHFLQKRFFSLAAVDVVLLKGHQGLIEDLKNELCICETVHTVMVQLKYLTLTLKSSLFCKCIQILMLFLQLQVIDFKFQQGCRLLIINKFGFWVQLLNICFFLNGSKLDITNSTASLSTLFGDWLPPARQPAQSPWVHLACLASPRG